MVNIDFNEASERIGIKRSFFDKIVKNGKEIPFIKEGRKYVVSEEDLENWINIKESRKIELNRSDFFKALRFALEINYQGHTLSDFGSQRQRTFMQAIENWTQGVLAEIALQKFIKSKFNIELQLEFRIFENAIVGQDIVGVKKGRVINPPRINLSVKSGKKNGMVLIVPPKEVEANERLSDYYVFVRVVFPVDIFARLYREIPDLEDLKDKIPVFENIQAYIIGYCKRNELEKRTVPEAGIDNERYVKVSGELHNSDEEWESLTENI